MPFTHRLTDVCTGHPCWPPRPTAAGSPDTFVNGLNQIRCTDPYHEHCCGPSCHGGTSIEGSGIHFTNGLYSTRQGDKLSCSCICFSDTHSPDKIIGGPPTACGSC